MCPINFDEVFDVYFSPFHRVILGVKHLLPADLGFCGGGGAKPLGVAGQHTILQNFPNKIYETKNNLIYSGTHHKSANTNDNANLKLRQDQIYL